MSSEGDGGVDGEGRSTYVATYYDPVLCARRRNSMLILSG
jgi:hypothetical protein